MRLKTEDTYTIARYRILPMMRLSFVRRHASENTIPMCRRADSRDPRSHPNGVKSTLGRPLPVPKKMVAVHGVMECDRTAADVTEKEQR